MYNSENGTRGEDRKVFEMDERMYLDGMER